MPRNIKYYILKLEILNCVHSYLKFQFAVERGSSGNGYVALDDVLFETDEGCQFVPPDAKPVDPTTIPPTTTTTTKGPTTAPPPTTTGPPTTTTVEPTEPPDCKNHLCELTDVI